MGLFSKKSFSEMSDKQLTRELKHKGFRQGESIASKARGIKEAQKRGLSWKDSDLNYKK